MLANFLISRYFFGFHARYQNPCICHKMKFPKHGYHDYEHKNLKKYHFKIFTEFSVIIRVIIRFLPSESLKII